jgi:hypothetical protein
MMNGAHAFTISFPMTQFLFLVGSDGVVGEKINFANWAIHIN